VFDIGRCPVTSVCRKERFGPGRQYCVPQTMPTLPGNGKDPDKEPPFFFLKPAMRCCRAAAAMHLPRGHGESSTMKSRWWDEREGTQHSAARPGSRIRLCGGPGQTRPTCSQGARHGTALGFGKALDESAPSRPFNRWPVTAIIRPSKIWMKVNDEDDSRRKFPK